MNARERLVSTLTFGATDRVPFNPGGPRESTITAWHSQGLPADARWRPYLMKLLGIAEEKTAPPVRLNVDFRMIPQFEERILSHEDGHYVVQDWKGNVCEIADTFDVTYLRHAKDFVTRRWIKCPVESRDDWEAMKERYAAEAPGRFPADFEERCRRARERDWVLSIHVNGPFWQMREWCGFEGLCVMMIEQPDLVGEMAAFWTEFVASVLDRILAHVVPDVFGISEDMAYKAKAMISPAMTREFCKPSYDRWAGQLRRAGCPVIDMDSDGYVGELIPVWVDSSINCCNPMEVAALNDINEYRRLFGRQMAYRGGVDKRAMARGGEVLRRELARIEPVLRDGGYVPGCDHGVPADVSWPNFVDYSRRLAELTGWL